MLPGKMEYMEKRVYGDDIRSITRNDCISLEKKRVLEKSRHVFAYEGFFFIVIFKRAIETHYEGVVDKESMTQRVNRFFFYSNGIRIAFEEIYEQQMPGGDGIDAIFNNQSVRHLIHLELEGDRGLDEFKAIFNDTRIISEMLGIVLINRPSMDWLLTEAPITVRNFVYRTSDEILWYAKKIDGVRYDFILMDGVCYIPNLSTAIKTSLRLRQVLRGHVELVDDCFVIIDIYDIVMSDNCIYSKLTHLEAIDVMKTPVFFDSITNDETALYVQIFEKTREALPESFPNDGYLAFGKCTILKEKKNTLDLLVSASNSWDSLGDIANCIFFAPDTDDFTGKGDALPVYTRQENSFGQNFPDWKVLPTIDHGALFSESPGKFRNFTIVEFAIDAARKHIFFFKQRDDKIVANRKSVFVSMIQ